MGIIFEVKKNQLYACNTIFKKLLKIICMALRVIFEGLDVQMAPRRPAG